MDKTITFELTGNIQIKNTNPFYSFQLTLPKLSHTAVQKIKDTVDQCILEEIMNTANDTNNKTTA